MKEEYAKMMWDSVSDEDKASLAQELKEASPVSDKLIEEAFASIEAHDIKVSHVELLDDDLGRRLEDLKKWKPDGTAPKCITDKRINDAWNKSLGIEETDCEKV